MRSQLLCLAATIACGLGATRAAADERVYRRALPSTVLIVSPAGLGTGVLVDAGRGWVVTANHVPEKQTEVMVAFPEYHPSGRPITEASHYLKKKTLLPGKVVARRPACDLALVEIDSVPRQASSMPLSASGAQEGQAVHVVGNSNVDAGALFGFVSGQVRNVFTLEAGPKARLVGRVVLTSVATNTGDSGGPVVNNDGELVAIVSSGTTGQGDKQVRDYCVDVSEVQALLDSHRPRKPYTARTGGLEVNPYEPSLTQRKADDLALTLWKPQSPPRLFPPGKPDGKK